MQITRAKYTLHDGERFTLRVFPISKCLVWKDHTRGFTRLFRNDLASEIAHNYCLLRNALDEPQADIALRAMWDRHLDALPVPAAAHGAPLRL